MSQGATNGRRVVCGILQHLDVGGLWGDADAVESALGIVRRSCALEQQQYLLFSELVHHMGSEALFISDKQVLPPEPPPDGRIPRARSPCELRTRSCQTQHRFWRRALGNRCHMGHIYMALGNTRASEELLRGRCSGWGDFRATLGKPYFLEP